MICFCALCFGIVLWFLVGFWWVGLILSDCVTDYCLDIGVCSVYLGFGKVDLVGGLRNGVKAYGGGGGCYMGWA